MAKELLVRGKAATQYQETLLEDFISFRTEASVDEWRAILDGVFNSKHGMINTLNVDGKVLDLCENTKNLSLARSYINFMKHSGRKFNGASVCHFLRVCHRCDSELTDEDRKRIQQFTKFLLTKYTIMDPLVGDGAVKGLILCNLGDQSLHIIENLEKCKNILSTTYSAYGIYLLRKKDVDGAVDIANKVLRKSGHLDDNFYLTWLDVYKNDRVMLDRLLQLLSGYEMKLPKLLCDHIIETYNRLPQPHQLEGHYGTITNA